MTTRRTFMKALGAIPPAISLSPAWANTDPSRQALVIGNSAYTDAPLTNPVNDARAVAALLGQAGFTVSSHLNATRVDMMGAIEHFAAAVRKSDTKQVMLYFAGHGAQLDWRNYLLPVDAKAQSAEQLRQSCVDLNQLIGELGKTKGKTFIIMLDACRNNPFGSSYQPEQKGLSQFDAPVGSLLAYATSPGNVASDGTGSNGLYTENVLREFSVKSAKIEDALKRVRLNVRLASNGAQIPWETTSLENDVFIFDGGKTKLSEAEQERLLEEETAEWSRIKIAGKPDDYIKYLRKFPDGRFAEIVQARLARLLAEVERVRLVEAERARKKAEMEKARLLAEAEKARQLAEAEQARVHEVEKVRPLAETEKARLREAEKARLHAEAEKARLLAAESSRPQENAAASTKYTPQIKLAPGMPVPLFMEPAMNPYSAGRYPLARHYSVGDSATFRETDTLSGVEKRVYTDRVTSVDTAADRVQINNGSIVADQMGNPLRLDTRVYDFPIQLYPTELQIGKKWRALGRVTRHGNASDFYLDIKVIRREVITVPAGTFDTFLIESEGWNNISGNFLIRKFWLVPGLNWPVRREFMTRNRSGNYIEAERHELVELTQGSVDESCAARANGTAQRNLVIRNNCG